MRAWIWYLFPTPFAFWIANKVNPSCGASIGTHRVNAQVIYRGKKRNWFVAVEDGDRLVGRNNKTGELIYKTPAD